MRADTIEVVDAMENFGGSFVRALAACIRSADSENMDKIHAAFPKYWAKYRKMAGMADEEVTACAASDDADNCRAALLKISTSPFCNYQHSAWHNAEGPYSTGVTDGHREAAKMAREALNQTQGD